MMIMMMMTKKVKGCVSVRCKQRKEKVKELGSKWKGQARPLRMRDMPTRVQQADKVLAGGPPWGWVWHFHLSRRPTAIFQLARALSTPGESVIRQG